MSYGIFFKIGGANKLTTVYKFMLKNRENCLNVFATCNYRIPN